MSISSQQTHSGGMPSTAYAPEAGHFYRFYSIDIGGRIALAEDHECESDAAALALGNRASFGEEMPENRGLARQETRRRHRKPFVARRMIKKPAQL